MAKGYYVLNSLNEGPPYRSVVKTAAALSGKLERGAWMDLFKKWVGRERPTHVGKIDWPKVYDLHRAGHSPKQAATHYLENLKRELGEAYAPSHSKIIGSFTEKSKGRRFDYSHHNDEWAHSHSLPHLIHFTNNEARYGHVKGTVAYIATDENALGAPVLDRWEIKKHYKFHTEARQMMSPAMRGILIQKRRAYEAEKNKKSDPLNPHGSVKYQEKELNDWRKKHKWKIMAGIGAGTALLGGAALYDKINSLGPWTPPQTESTKKTITISYLPLLETIGGEINTSKKNKERKPIDSKEGKVGEKAGEIKVRRAASYEPTVDDPETDDKKSIDSPEFSSKSKYDIDDKRSQEDGNPHFKHTKQRPEDEKADQVTLNQKPDQQGFDNTEDKTNNDNRDMKTRETEADDGEGGLKANEKGGKKLSKAAQKVKDIYNKKNGKDGSYEEDENGGEDKPMLDRNGEESTEDEPTGDSETINFNPTIDNITTQATGI